MFQAGNCDINKSFDEGYVVRVPFLIFQKCLIKFGINELKQNVISSKLLSLATDILNNRK